MNSNEWRRENRFFYSFYFLESVETNKDQRLILRKHSLLKCEQCSRSKWKHLFVRVQSIFNNRDDFILLLSTITFNLSIDRFLNIFYSVHFICRSDGDRWRSSFFLRNSLRYRFHLTNDFIFWREQFLWSTIESVIFDRRKCRQIE